MLTDCAPDRPSAYRVGAACPAAQVYPPKRAPAERGDDLVGNNPLGKGIKQLEMNDKPITKEEMINLRRLMRVGDMLHWSMSANQGGEIVVVTL